MRSDVQCQGKVLPASFAGRKELRAQYLWPGRPCQIL